MRYFSNEVNLLDAKGRVCLPAKLRGQMPEQQRDRIFAYKDVLESRILLFDESFLDNLLSRLHAEEPSAPQLTGATTEEMSKVQQYHKKLRQQHDARYRSISNGFLTQITMLKIDEVGRMLLAPELLEHAKIKRKIRFCGLGRVIGAYDPEVFSSRQAESVEQQLQARQHVTDIMGGLP